MNYNQLKTRLKKNVFLESDVRQIENKVQENVISEEQGFKFLQELEKKGSFSLPPIENEDWKQLIRIIDESEQRLKKSLRFQLLIALLEVPLFIIVFLFSLKLELLNEHIVTLVVLMGTMLGVLISHTFFIMRIYQQGATAMERFSEKRVGILFLRIASNPANVNVDSDKLINAGTLMFLGHHVKPAEPLSSQDSPKTVKK